MGFPEIEYGFQNLRQFGVNQCRDFFTEHKMTLGIFVNRKGKPYGRASFVKFMGYIFIQNTGESFDLFCFECYLIHSHTPVCAKCLKNLMSTHNLHILVQGEELGPLEQEVNALQKNIDTRNQEIADQQQFWLRQQSELVKMSKDKDGESKEVDTMKKALTILHQKKMRIESRWQAMSGIIKWLYEEVNCKTASNHFTCFSFRYVIK